MQEENISNYLGHYSLRRASTNPINNTSPHKRPIRVSLSTPDIGAKIDKLAEKKHRSTAERGANRNPAKNISRRIWYLTSNLTK